MSESNDSAIPASALRKTARCPTCDTPFKPVVSSPAMPFCSIRCKMADLNRWFDEGIGLPYLRNDEDEDDEQEPPPVIREWNFD